MKRLRILAMTTFIRRLCLDYGKPITEAEYNKQLNADKDEN